MRSPLRRKMESSSTSYSSTGGSGAGLEQPRVNKHTLSIANHVLHLALLPLICGNDWKYGIFPRVISYHTIGLQMTTKGARSLNKRTQGSSARSVQGCCWVGASRMPIAARGESQSKGSSRRSRPRSLKRSRESDQWLTILRSKSL